SVRAIDNKRSHWVAKGPLGIPVEWDAEIYTERAGEMISWRSLPGSVVDTAGSVHFQTLAAGRGCQVRVELRYNPPGDNLGVKVVKMLGDTPDQQIEQDLRRFKQRMETGTPEYASR